MSVTRSPGFDAAPRELARAPVRIALERAARQHLAPRRRTPTASGCAAARSVTRRPYETSAMAGSQCAPRVRAPPRPLPARRRPIQSVRIQSRHEQAARPGGDRRHRPDAVLQGSRALRVRHGDRGDPRRLRRRGHLAARDRRRGPLRHGDARTRSSCSRSSVPGCATRRARAGAAAARSRCSCTRRWRSRWAWPNHVLVFRSRARGKTVGLRQGRAAGRPLLGAHRPSGCPSLNQWHVPHGLVSAFQEMAMITRRHMIDYGTTEEHFAEVAVATRAPRARNPERRDAHADDDRGPPRARA